MPLYDYTGQLPSGALFTGTLEAVDEPQAQALLGDMGVRVTTLQATRRAAYVVPLSLADVTFFNEQLTAMTKAGLPLEAGLRQLASDVASNKLKRLVLEVADDLAAGTPLEQALQRQQSRFPPHYADVVRAGLKTGDLGGTLYGLTTHLRLKSGLRRVLLEVIAYPMVVLLLAIFVSSFVMRTVVPAIEELAQELARDTYGSADSRGPFLFIVARAWPVMEAGLLFVVLLLAAMMALSAFPGMRGTREWFLRRLPSVARVYWSSVQARFAHTSALAAYSGTPLPDMLRASGAASGSPALAAAAERAAARVEQGERLDSAVEQERDMPGLWVCAVQTAGPRGDLPGALAELARTYEVQAQQSVNTTRAIVGPVLFLFMATTLGLLIASVLGALSWIIRMIQGVTGF